MHSLSGNSITLYRTSAEQRDHVQLLRLAREEHSRGARGVMGRGQTFCLSFSSFTSPIALPSVTFLTFRTPRSIPASMYTVGKQQKSLLSSHFRFLLANGNDVTNNTTWESTAECFYLVKSYPAISSTDSKVGLPCEAYRNVQHASLNSQ